MTTEKSKAGRKSNTVEYSEKITEALELMLYKKLTAGEFRVTFSKKYNVSERMADNTWKHCKELIKERFTEKQDEIINQQLSRYFDLLERARTIGDRRVERDVLNDLNKLYGLDTKKVDVTSNGESISVNIVLNND